MCQAFDRLPNAKSDTHLNIWKWEKRAAKNVQQTIQADQSERSVSFNPKFPPVDEALEDKINAATRSDCFLRGI